ncbi:hypothetical protein [Gilvimarinus sp. DA14]|uniref:hypothetical protein n=1 Tax=Gilvimarinus sp. DA14 TaxID=2956798 RepID=UPI0020B7AB26|nr:hypothetical protein [Gilvimarinus sp. DA14]UTF59839.1 hypothetical protein NHM04_15410 [Gilvimarinus sp. DA14]
MLRRYICLSFTMVSLFVGVTGCALLEPKSDEEVVAQRAQEWSNALLEQDYSSAYAYTSPGFKSRESARKYTKRYAGSGIWINTNVEKVACEVDTCEVVVKVRYKIQKQNLTASTLLTEKWVKVDGDWWLYHSD